MLQKRHILGKDQSKERWIKIKMYFTIALAAAIALSTISCAAPAPAAVCARAQNPDPVTSIIPSIPAITGIPVVVPPGSKTWPPGQSYAKVVIDHHKAHRLNHSDSHSTATLKWNQTLANAARVLAARCDAQLTHDTSIGPGGYGQNLFAAAGPGSADALDIGAVISGSWYNEVNSFPQSLYGQANIDDMSLFEKVGHFTQVVWNSTTDVGCANYNCAGRGGWDHYTVCNYWPPGNMGGEYGQNVHPPVAHPMRPITLQRGY